MYSDKLKSDARNFTFSASLINNNPTGLDVSGNSSIYEFLVFAKIYLYLGLDHIYRKN